MKIIAFYLPQFHNIPENDEWWGDGFTEWTNVKAAYPLYSGHDQPKIPLNNNYYNLLNDDVKIWQANLANNYGVYGFCYYHYWFNGKLLLEKPMEQMLNNKEIKIKFCICWANEPWAKAWVGEDKKILIPQKYGERQDWEKHFYYMLPFFKDSRYILDEGKPVMVIYRPKVISCLKEMIDCWQELAIENGLPGLKMMCATNNIDVEDDCYNYFDNLIEWQPHTAKWIPDKFQNQDNFVIKFLKKSRRYLWKKFENTTGIDLYKYDPIAQRRQNQKKYLDYDLVWKKVISMDPLKEKSLPGAFVRWDNTARYKENATIIKGETPEKFKYYLKKQIEHARAEYNSEYLFMYAWNEWAEGGFLEPDEKNGYRYLEAIKEALEETGEFDNM